ncbi:MAG: hypothetical protein SGI96_14605 [Bacteroidota bacterium]|nr:hypothetical protein [Bacteroidota bacterium]
MELSTAQKILKFFTSKSLFEKMMTDSKLYRFTCSCGKESSIFDIGGIRYKAYGTPKTGVRCPHCKKRSMLKIYKVKP